MKYIKTVLASFLTVLFLMSGCSTGNKGKDGGSINSGDVKNTNLAASEMKKGAAAQQEITFEKSEKMETLSQLSDGTLLGYNQDYTLKYSSKDNGVTWETAQMNTKNLFPEGEEYPHNTTIDSEGNVYLAFGSQNSQNENDVPFMIQKLSLDGTISKIEIKEVQQFIESGESFDLYQMESLSPDRLLLTFEYGKTFVEYEEGKVAEENGKIKNAVYDPHTGEKVYDVEENQMDYFRGDIYSDDSNWYSPVVTGESSETPMLNCFSVKDGKKLRTIELKDLNENPFQNSHFFISQKTLLVIDRDNIYTVNPESGELTLQLEGSKLIYTLPDSFLTKLFMIEDGKFIALAYSNGDTKIYQFYFDENAVYDVNGKLTVWSLQKNDSFDYFKTAFLKLHPEADVAIESFVTGEEYEVTSAEKDDAIKKMNTRLLSGEVPDILLTDGLPAEKYAKEGLLMNLDGKVDTSAMLGTFAEQLKIEDGLFYLPTSFAAYAMFTENEEILNVKNFDEWISVLEKSAGFNASKDREKIESYRDTTGKYQSLSYDIGEMPVYFLPEEIQPVLTADQFQEIFDVFWNLNETAVVKDSKIEEENLKKLLTAMKIVAEKSQVFENGEIYAKGGDEYDFSQYYEQSLYSRNHQNSLDSYYNQNIGKASLEWIGDIRSIRNYETGEAIHPNEKVLAAPALQEGVWIPKTMLAIGAKSERADLAVDFLQTALSEEVQTNVAVERGDLSVVKNVMTLVEKKEKEEFEEEQNLHKKGNSEEIIAFRMNLEEFAQKLKTPFITDEVVKMQIWNPAVQYCQGEISMEEAMSQIHQTTKIYLGERAG